jgi:RNA polymerase sigma-70 factor (ECF subfamily)
MNCSEMPDEDLMRGVANGNTAAFRQLFDRWKLPLLNFIFRATGNFPDAEDITMKVFEDIWKTAPQYTAQGTFSAWLFAIGRNKLRQHWRTASRRLPVMPPDDLLAGEAADNNDPARRAESEEALVIALQALPDAQREALLLSIHSRLQGAELAELLGISLQNFHVLVHRARSSLLNHMKSAIA